MLTTNPGLAGQLLPWIVIANIVVTLAAIFVVRVFAVGQWAAQQKQLADEVHKLTEQLEAANTNVAQLTLKSAVMAEQIKNLMRGGRA